MAFILILQLEDVVCIYFYYYSLICFTRIISTEWRWRFDMAWYGRRRPCRRVLSFQRSVIGSVILDYFVRFLPRRYILFWNDRISFQGDFLLSPFKPPDMIALYLFLVRIHWYGNKNLIVSLILLVQQACGLLLINIEQREMSISRTSYLGLRTWNILFTRPIWVSFQRNENISFHI